MKKRQYDVVIYHDACPDGIGAAWAARHHLGGGGVKYHAMHHDHELPERLIRDKRVLVVDFAFKRKDHIRAAKICEKIVVVDHHIGAYNDIGDLPDTHFNMNHSGAVLAWEHFTGNTDSAPVVLKYIEDRDLWKWTMKDTKEYLALFDSYPISMDTVELFTHKNAVDVVEEGRTIARYKDAVVTRLLDTACVGAFKDNSVYSAPIGICNVNCRDFMSDIANRMIYDWGYDVGVSWHYDGHRTDLIRVSIRSRKGSDIDVSAIAKKFGGGGHKHAAGWQIDGSDARDVFDFPLIAVA